VAQEDNVNVTGVALFAVGLAGVAAAVYVLVWLMFGYFATREATANAVEYPMATSQETRLPPEPRLQTNPRGDLQNLREQEDALLKGYSWVDKPSGIVRIPIDQAMRLTIERGLPARRKEQEPAR
jgi:hypothetical protein